ncbi:unnamed protein product, partial [Rotaria sp. Silwood1]
MTQLYSIYGFCSKQEKNEGWTKESSKLRGIYTTITPICDSITQLAQQYDENAVAISAASSSLNQIEPSFMYTQLFKEIILEIDFDKEKEINELAQYAREKYVCKEKDLKIIDEFAREYRGDLDESNKPIWWYTRQCFTYQMLNKALRALQVETLMKMAIFIRDLHQNIEKLYSQQSNEIFHGTIVQVYRGQFMAKEDFSDKIKQGGLISFNNFLSTSDDRNVAIRFISKALPESSSIRVLFDMTVNQVIQSAPFAHIDKISYYKTEKEILFSMHTVFRIQHIGEIEESRTKMWQVKLTLTSENDDKCLHVLTKQMRKEITGSG